MEKRTLLITVLLTTVMAARSQTPLESALLAAVREAHFERVVDFGAGNEAHPARRPPVPVIAHAPNVNVAVIQLDAAGRMTDRAYVLL